MGEQLDLLFSTASETHVADNGARVEVGTVQYCGNTYANLGSIVDHERGCVVGYVGKDNRTLTTWEGKPIGTVREISKWRTPRSWVSSYMHAYVAEVDGKRYHGRGCGEGMVLKLHASKSRG